MLINLGLKQWIIEERRKRFFPAIGIAFEKAKV